MKLKAEVVGSGGMMREHAGRGGSRVPWHPFPNEKKDLQNMYTGQVDADSLSPVCIVIFFFKTSFHTERWALGWLTELFSPRFSSR
jgi:hypothetical protein